MIASLLAPVLGWLARLVFGKATGDVVAPLAEKVVEEGVDFVSGLGDEPGTPLPYSAVEHQRAQAQAAAHAAPPRPAPSRFQSTLRPPSVLPRRSNAVPVPLPASLELRRRVLSPRPPPIPPDSPSPSSGPPPRLTPVPPFPLPPPRKR